MLVRPFKASFSLLILMCLFFAQACVTDKLPPVTGEFPVGTREFTIKACMVESDGSKSCPPTEILVQAWYPAAPKGEPVAPYIPHPETSAPALAETLHVPGFVAKNIASVKTNSHWNAALNPRRDKYPLLLFSHGYHSLRIQNTVLMEQLASLGHIIFAVQYSYDAATTVMPDGAVIDSVADTPKDKSLDEEDALRGSWTDRRVGEARAVLDNLRLAPKDFAQAIDTDRIAAIGHSMGGSTTTALCREESRLKACINLDGPLRGSRQSGILLSPILFMEAALPQYETPEQEVTYKERLREMKKSARAGYVHLRIKDSGHLNFTDFPALTGFPLQWFSRTTGSLGRAKSLGINFYYINSFLNHAFAGRKTILTTDEMKHYPEAILVDQVQRN